MFFPFLVILPGLIAIALPTMLVNPPAAAATGSTVTEPGKAAAVAKAEAVAHAPGRGLIPAKVDPISGKPMLDSDGKPQLDYDLAIPNMLLHYFPTGMLGLGLTALLASFMSGMAGNITAFNTVWTFDIYQAYHPPQGQRPPLHVDGPVRHAVRHDHLHRGGLRGDPVQQHHGPPATGLRLRECPPVRHFPARHVLEARDRPRGVLRPALGDRRRGRPPRVDAAGGFKSRGSRGVGSRSCIPIPARWPRASGRPSSPGRPASWSRSS